MIRGNFVISARIGTADDAAVNPTPSEVPVTETAPLIVVFAIYPGVTQLDFTGPYEVMHRLRGARVITASGAGGLVQAEGGLTFVTERLSDVASCDVICIPGGGGQTAAMADPAYMEAVRRLARGARYVTSVCSGSIILGAAGVLKGKRSACHWAWRELLPLFGAEPVAQRVVRDGGYFSGGGVTAGIDFALTLAAEIDGEPAAKAIQLILEYAPEPPFDCGTPETADAEVLAAVWGRMAAMGPARRAAAMGAFEGA
jgi:cyclohexyl-isocyanide hydratase